ncbi:MAG TPA: hypothetical protein EYG46_15765 [Myxococcales bacterium]|nr:hypothetical protein [Myxococcales bacterium]HIM02439.1 hypothetical protein [Myxococcales bacterium]
MTSSTPSQVKPDVWLFGPVPDVLFGCGLGYIIVLGLFIGWGPSAQAWLPTGVLALVLLFTSVPHYGATLMRVYDNRETRQKYFIFSVAISVALLVAFAVACHSQSLGSGLVTVYFNWSPWHYAGQNFGIALMLLHRRDVTITSEAKRWLYASFVFAFLMSFINLNGIEQQAGYVFESAKSAGGAASSIYPLIRLGIPEGIQKSLLVVGLLLYLTTTTRALSLLRRGSNLRDLIPAGLVMLSQSLWFVVPVMMRKWSVLPDSIPFSERDHQYAFLLIAISHAVQYLWITTYYARREKAMTNIPSYLAWCVLAGSFIWYLPESVFSSSRFGNAELAGGLTVLIAATVNIHHFILDGAIWKLRDGRVASVLLRKKVESAGAPRESQRKRWIRGPIWLIGLLLFATTFVGDWEREFGVRRAAARGDIGRVQDAVARLDLIGQDDAEVRRRLGMIAVRQDRSELALAEFERSIELKPHPKAYFEIGKIYDSRAQWSQAAIAYESAYKLDSHPRKLIGRFAQSLIRSNQLDRALEVLRVGVGRHPQAPALRSVLRDAEDRALNAPN